MTTKVIVGLDYELFFGESTGTTDNCLIKPTNEITQVLERHNAKLCLFVDAAYLIKLKQMSQFPSLREDYRKIAQQLSFLREKGHDIQLHVHPHWIDSTYDGKKWIVKTSRYRLHDFDTLDINKIIKNCCDLIKDLSGDSPFAFRAGGWCLQPFKEIANGLYDNGVWLDSTVFEKGSSDDPVRWYDYSITPGKPYWYFDDDPVSDQSNGRFLEIPISSCKLTPLFFWRMAIRKKLSGKQFKAFGDGASMIANAGYYLSRLTRSTYSPVSIDGLKSGNIGYAYHKHKARFPSGVFNIMGHPKSLTPRSLKYLDRFFSDNKDIQPITFRDLQHMKPIPKTG